MTKTKRTDIAEELYNKNVDMIRNLAWKFSRTSSIDFNELMSVGEMAFMKAFTAWDGKRRFSTLLYRVIKNALIIFVRDTDAPQDMEVQLMMMEAPQPSVESGLVFKELLTSLSKEAQYVAKLIINGPAEAFGILGTEPPKMIRGAIQRYLVKQKGLTHKRSWEVIQELKEAF